MRIATYSIREEWHLQSSVRYTVKLTELLQIAALALASLGGAGAIIVGFGGWLGKFVSDRLIAGLQAEFDRKLETHKTRLRKSEFLFQKELDAASGFVSLRRKWTPKYDYPDKEWDDACQEVAMNFESIETDLETYVAQYKPFIRDDCAADIGKALSLVSGNKFYAPPHDQPPRAVLDGASAFLDLTETIEGKLILVVRSQAED
jgi:hypothetical protein